MDAHEVSKPSKATLRHLSVQTKFKFNHMRLISAIDQHGSLSAAAITLNISQPAASRMIAEMEAIVDVALLERHARGVSLTSYGQVLARRARAILIELSEVETDIADLRTGRGGTVHLGAVTSAVVELAIPAVQEVRRQFPRLDVTVHEESSPVLARELLASRHDFIVARVPEDLNPRLFESRVIGGERGCLLTRAGHPLLREQQIDLEKTRDYEWVLQPSGSLLRRALVQNFLRHDIPLPERILNTGSMLMTMVMVAQSDAITAVTRDVARFLRSPNGLAAALEVLPFEFEVEMQPYSLITVANRTLSPAARLLYNAILSATR